MGCPRRSCMWQEYLTWRVVYNPKIYERMTITAWLLLLLYRWDPALTILLAFSRRRMRKRRRYPPRRTEHQCLRATTTTLQCRCFGARVDDFNILSGGRGGVLFSVWVLSVPQADCPIFSSSLYYVSRCPSIQCRASEMESARSEKKLRRGRVLVGWFFVGWLQSMELPP
jgi:hypothetical protein